MAERSSIPTAAAAAKRDSLRAEAPSASTDAAVKGQRDGANSAGNAQNRPRTPGAPVKEVRGKSGEGRISPGDGSNRARIQPGSSNRK
jgi:hypothetical protein